MKGTRVINNQVCYPEALENDVQTIFDSKRSQQKEFYNETLGFECLLIDILKETNFDDDLPF